MCSTKTRSTNIPAFCIRLMLLLASVTFSVNALADPQIVNPLAGSTLSGSAQTFNWNSDGADAERFWLYVGSTVGGRDIANSGDLGLDTEYDVIGIPADGSTIHARLWYYSSSRWFYVDSSFTAADLDVEIVLPITPNWLARVSNSNGVITTHWSTTGGFISVLHKVAKISTTQDQRFGPEHR